MKHIISVLVENKFGVLTRVAGLFSARGFNIDSLAVGETEDHSISRMTIVVSGDDRILEQVTKQLHKLIDVIKVQDLTKDEFIDRELVLIKVLAAGDKRSEVMQIVDIFRANIVDVDSKSVVVEITGGRNKVTALMNLLAPFGIKEITRTGRIAMVRRVKE